MTDVEIAWVAGIIEGEGCLLLERGIYPRVAVTMTDEDVILKLFKVTGTGTCVSKQPLKSGKIAYHWQVRRYEDVARFLMQIIPHLGNRRKVKAFELLDAIFDRIKNKICVTCGVSFSPGKFNQIHCGSKCRSKNWEVKNDLSRSGTM